MGSSDVTTSSTYDRPAEMRKRWADPAWKAKQRRAISGAVKSWYAIGRDARVVKTYVEPATLVEMQAAAKARGEHISELVRMYIVWGLEAEKS